MLTLMMCGKAIIPNTKTVPAMKLSTFLLLEDIFKTVSNAILDKVLQPD